jgi:hypothetical protein
MKRISAVLVFVMLAGGVWRAAESYRAKHPVSGRDITLPVPTPFGMLKFPKEID